MNVNQASIYTWQSFKGNLNLYQEDNEFRLTYIDKATQTETPIPKQNIEGINFENIANNVNEFCRKYFFKKTNLENDIAITFFEAADLANFGKSKSSKGIVSFEFNALDKKELIDVTTEGPSYKIICAGLNMEGECVNKVCVAYEKLVVIPKGLGLYRVAEELDECVCPACDVVIPADKIKNLGFYDCSISIKGKENYPENKIVTLEEVTPENSYLTYKENTNCQWTYLNVTTKKQEQSSWCALL